MSDLDEIAEAARGQQGPRPQVVYVYRDRPVQPIERTGKAWKLMILVGWLLMLGGIAVFLLLPHWARGEFTMAQGIIGLGSVLAVVVGLILLVLGKAGAWWYHA